MKSIEHMVSTVVGHLGDISSSGAISGEPIVVGDVTLVVLSMLSVGMGTGGGEGAGGAAKVRPAAVIAFTADGVQVLPIPNQPDLFDKVVERVPGVMDMVEQARDRFGGAAN